jgi:hypothetical protein
MSNLSVCPGTTACGESAPIPIRHPLGLPERGEPLIGNHPFLHRHLVGGVQRGFTHSRRQAGQRAANSDLGQLAGQPQVRNFVRIFDRAQVIEHCRRINQLDSGQAGPQPSHRRRINLEQVDPDPSRNRRDGPYRLSDCIKHGVEVKLRRPLNRYAWPRRYDAIRQTTLEKSPDID